MSKEMEALRRSKASASGDPNLPPQRCLCSLSSIAPQFSRTPANRPLRRRWDEYNGDRLLKTGDRRRSVGACDRARKSARSQISQVFPDGGLQGAQAQGSVTGAAADHVVTKLPDEGCVVEGEDLVHREALNVHLLHD